MLFCSEKRGPHANGTAWLMTGGDFRLFKCPIWEHQMVRKSTFHELVAEVDNQCTVLMGHTCWRTRGSEDNSRKHRAVLYGSEPEYIEAALDGLRGWRDLEIPPLTMLTFRHESLKEW